MHTEPSAVDRRTILATAAGLGMTLAGGASLYADEEGSLSTGRTSVPEGTVDCHVHVLEPQRFPYLATRSYTPGCATLADLQAFHARLGISRTVLVQPSVYGTDNNCLEEALAALGPGIARGVAVIDPETASDNDLRSLERAGVVGLRVNLNVKGEARTAAATAAVTKAVARAATHNLAIQIYVDLPLVAALAETIAGAPVPVVLDHFAGAQAKDGLRQPGFEALLRLLDAGRVWVKLSAPYRASTQAPDYADVTPIAQALIATNPQRLVWASDWPHTGGGGERNGRKTTDLEPFREVDDGRALSLISTWTRDPHIRRAILVDNAAHLFRF